MSDREKDELPPLEILAEVGKFYRHYKTKGIYKVESIVRWETDVACGMVVYRDIASGEGFVRGQVEFLEEVFESDEVGFVPRFEKISAEDGIEECLAIHADYSERAAELVELIGTLSLSRSAGSVIQLVSPPVVQRSSDSPNQVKVLAWVEVNERLLKSEKEAEKARAELPRVQPPPPPMPKPVAQGAEPPAKSKPKSPGYIPEGHF